MLMVSTHALAFELSEKLGGHREQVLLEHVSPVDSSLSTQFRLHLRRLRAKFHLGPRRYAKRNRWSGLFRLTRKTTWQEETRSRMTTLTISLPWKICQRRSMLLESCGRLTARLRQFLV